MSKKQFSIETIEKWISNSDWRVRAAAMKACNGRDVPMEVIWKGLCDSDCNVRAAALIACRGKDVPLEVVEKGIRDSDWRVYTAAMNACQGVDVSLEVIWKWLHDSDWRFRAAAMNACQGKNVLSAVIEKGLRDADGDVRTAAMNACVANGIEVPLIRTIEPPKRVYKKCVAGVIVVAEIPTDAQVRGTLTGKCRANKAKIVDIIGTCVGESVGISTYDLTTTYFVGDEIEVENFDYSDEECSTGFHFFCTLEQAENYNL